MIGAKMRNDLGFINNNKNSAWEEWLGSDYDASDSNYVSDYDVSSHAMMIER
jgi:hypothetical protein